LTVSLSVSSGDIWWSFQHHILLWHVSHIIVTQRIIWKLLKKIKTSTISLCWAKSKPKYTMSNAHRSWSHVGNLGNLFCVSGLHVCHFITPLYMQWIQLWSENIYSS
jgi:hypothetical protein